MRIAVPTKYYCECNIFTQMGAVRSFEWIFIIGVPVAVRTCDAEQSVLQSSFQIGSSTVTFTGTSKISS